jgi:3'-5' exoribonuclease Rv2179c-like domain
MSEEEGDMRDRLAAYIPADSVMIDIETIGTDTHRHAILQIGAVVFDSKFQEQATLDACLTTPFDRSPSPETIEWWRKTDSDLYRNLCDRAESFEAVLERFADWLPPNPHLWAWPASFDLAFIRSYAMDYNQHNLLGKMNSYRWIDCRSWIAGLRRDLATTNELEKLINEPPPFKGRVHDGLYDARWQVVCLERVASLISLRVDEAITSVNVGKGKSIKEMDVGCTSKNGKRDTHRP